MFACFECRKGFKRVIDKDILPEYLRPSTTVICPDCGGAMTNLGKDLRLPSKDKLQQWAAIHYLADNRFNFFSCGCSGIGLIPKDVAEARILVEERRSKSAGEILLSRL